jgi:hypothetical protein
MAHEIQPVDAEEEEYDENADEDFNPEHAAKDADDSSSSEDEDDTVATKKRNGKNSKKRSSTATEGLDSGDEATIQARKKRRRKGEAEHDDSGGEGGLIKTRAQRLAEKVEKKERRRTTLGEVTIDVDQMWADLSRVPVGRPAYEAPKTSDHPTTDGEQNKDNMPAAPPQEQMITVQREIEYAGEVTTITEAVPRSSKEAQRYLSEHPEADPDFVQKQDDAAPTSLHRPLKRPSIFEPNPTATVKGVAPEKLRPRAPSRFDVLLAESKAEEEKRKKAEKMSTVQKSALDWKGFVNKEEGLREELEGYGKSKQGFLAREEFLDRAHAVKEGLGREARLKG